MAALIPLCDVMTLAAGRKTLAPTQGYSIAAGMATVNSRSAHLITGLHVELLVIHADIAQASPASKGKHRQRIAHNFETQIAFQ
jgi:hypothetical protein